MIGLHLLLAPVSTVVKPACSVVVVHRPNPIQEGAMLSAEIQVDVTLGLWKKIGVTSVFFISVRSLGS